MVTFSTVVINKVGLHARPAAQFVDTAARYKSTIRLRKTGAQGPWMNAKSILSVLTMGVEQNQEIDLQIDGEDEQKAAAALKSLIEGNFGEK